MKVEESAQLFGELLACRVRLAAERSCREMTSGKPVKQPNPFEESYFPIHGAMVKLAEKLRGAGLDQDREFVWNLEKALRVAMATPIDEFLGELEYAAAHDTGYPIDGLSVTNGVDILPLNVTREEFGRQVGID